MCLLGTRIPVIQTLAGNSSYLSQHTSISSNIGYLEDAHLVTEAQRYDIKGRAYIGSPKKYYFEDIGMDDAVDPALPRVRARAVGAEHEDMLARSDGYMTAWLLWQLCDDGDAAQAFVGADAEIAHNPGWQDVEKSV